MICAIWPVMVKPLPKFRTDPCTNKRRAHNRLVLRPNKGVSPPPPPPPPGPSSRPLCNCDFFKITIHIHFHLHSPPWMIGRVNTAFVGNTPSKNWKFRTESTRRFVFVYRMGLLFFVCDFLMAYIVLNKVLYNIFLTPFHCARSLLLDCAFATCTSPIMHLICPPKFCISIVFNFSLDSCNTQEKWKTKVIQNLGGK